MHPIRIKITDHCQAVSPANSYLYRQLRRRFNVELVDEPDFLFFTVFGYEHALPKYDHCVKIWFTGENFRPDLTKCDYAISFDHLPNEPRHLRLPQYLHYIDPEGTLIKKPDFHAPSILKSKTRFCNFVYSNPEAKTRIKFFQKLSEYKQVDSGGIVLNNLGFRVSNKQSFLASYKFTIAFENACSPGYTTEKLVEPMLANSLPIYWGNPKVGEEFNTRSFLNCHDYQSFEEVIDEIIRLDQDDGRYIARMKEPWLIDNRDSLYTSDDYSTEFFERVFRTPRHASPKWAGIAPRFFADCSPKPNLSRLGLPEFRVFE
jgi:alpha(1,3/1,4) fucosyltransferase